ncbi:uridine-cytidine kinase-like 1 isoform X6 [Anguilla anguilla]|uniref:uridine-cytidine kinase-like 1 isoform X6 n=1 Tax=Anguilla anguilla TaxID=7936 RepID=UPI0015B1DCDD|nr:uridine-cytidine kinase-like 1 isoform X6 [Anguilla anguilla]
MASQPVYSGARILGRWSLNAEGSGSSEEALDRLLLPVSAPRRKSSSLGTPEPPLLRTSTRTIYTAGRPPWYNQQGAQSKDAFVIGLCGGSASGKTTVANKIIEALGVPWVVLLSMDSFYKVLSPEEEALAASNDYNFDHPNAFDFDLLVQTIRKLKQGKSVKIPMYDFTTHGRQKEWKNVYGASVIIFEGIMSFSDKELLQLLDMKIFVDADSDIRLVRRLRRDITERGRDIEGVIKQYNKSVKPAFEQYIEPTMRLADIVVPRGGDNMVAIDLIVQHVHSQLEEVSPGLCSPGPASSSDSQCAGEHASGQGHAHLPQTSTVQTPQGQDYEGRRFCGKGITGVSILRAGETMEPALRAVCKDCRIGKILIQTNQDSGEPELHYLRLPKDISEDHVILMDCTVSTGAAAMMALRVLLDHDVEEGRILLVSLLMAEMGVHSVAYAFPQVKIITTAIDKSVDELFHIIPGMGNFGDRYFGTDALPDRSDEEGLGEASY